MAIADSFTYQHKVKQATLLLWASLFLLPFIRCIAYHPIPNWFIGVSVVLITSMLWLTLLVCHKLPSRIPSTSYWMIGLAIIWFIQPLCVDILFPGFNVWAVLVFLSMALLAYVSSGLQHLWTAEKLVSCLAWALVIGAVMQAIVGILQFTGLASHLHGWIAYDSSHKTTIIGIIGQRNLYAHYLAWGMLATGYLVACHQLKSWIAIGLILLLASLMAWNGSRTVVLYLIAMAAVATSWHSRLQTTQSRQIWVWLCAISMASLIIQWLLPQLDQWLTIQSTSGIERIIGAQASSIGRRQTEWHKAWLVFQNYPWFGCGWSQFAQHSLTLHLRPEFIQSDFSSSLFTNVHNLVLHLLAEMGVIGTLTALVGFIWAIHTYFTQPAQHTSILPFGMMMITLLHSMVEYPLWNMGFLAVFVVAVTLAPQRTGVPNDEHIITSFWKRRLVPALSGLTVAALLFLMFFHWSTYSTLTRIYMPIRDAKTYNQRVIYLQDMVDHNTLFSFYALITLNNYLVASHQALDLKLYYIKQLAKIRPFPNIMLKKAKLEALAGRLKESEHSMALVLASFPTLAKTYLKTLPAEEPAYQQLRKMTQTQHEQLPQRYK
ncbi:MAG: O-antigen ligase C-terminal domain-containing protein [Neisseriales bacterium]|nr:MAG: O-antigen ligase C-terminal domain-containing protein [Neisseriales bacterium]